MNWDTLYCPNRGCHCYGIPFNQTGSRLARNGATHGQPKALCRSCSRSVFLRYGTAYFGLESDPAVFEMVFRALAEGTSLHSAARIVEVDPVTTQRWLDRAAQHFRPWLRA